MGPQEVESSSRLDWSGSIIIIVALIMESELFPEIYGLITAMSDCKLHFNYV